MKVICSTKDIASAVGAASKVVNAHTTVPILSNVLLQARTEGFRPGYRSRAHPRARLCGRGRRARIGHRSAKLFSTYLANLAAAHGTERTATRASVKCGKSNYDFHALPADEYPPLPAVARGSHFTINGKRLRDGIDATIFAASNEEARGRF